jgi:hypothetical protein
MLKVNLSVIFYVFTAVTTKSVVFWHKEPSSYLTGDTLRLRCRAQPVKLWKVFGFHCRDYEQCCFWDVTPLALIRTDVSEDLITSITRVIRIGELGTTLAVTSNRSTLRRNTTYLIIPFQAPQWKRWIEASLCKLSKARRTSLEMFCARLMPFLLDDVATVKIIYVQQCPSVL